jgi:hypothetical protein
MLVNSLLVFQSWIKRAHPSGRLLLVHRRVASAIVDSSPSVILKCTYTFRYDLDLSNHLMLFLSMSWQLWIGTHVPARDGASSELQGIERERAIWQCTDSKLWSVSKGRKGSKFQRLTSLTELWEFKIKIRKNMRRYSSTAVCCSCSWPQHADDHETCISTYRVSSLHSWSRLHP